MGLENVCAVMQSKIDLLNLMSGDHIMEEITLPPLHVRVHLLFLKPTSVVQCLEMLRLHSDQCTEAELLQGNIEALHSIFVYKRYLLYKPGDPYSSPELTNKWKDGFHI